MTKKEVCAFHYIDNQQADELKEELMRIGRMLNSMIAKSKLFCDQSDYDVHEEISKDVP